MTDKDDLSLATEIAVAFLNHNPLSVSEIPELLLNIRRALAQDLPGDPSVPSPLSRGEADDGAIADPSTGPLVKKRDHAVRQIPAVAPEDSVHEDYLISLEDGRRYRSLRRHLMAKYGLSPDEYRRKWRLPPDYPMVAPSYARERSEVAKRTGLGRLAKPRAMRGSGGGKA